MVPRRNKKSYEKRKSITKKENVSQKNKKSHREIKHLTRKMKI